MTAAPVNVAISQISSATNIITLVPYVVRVLFGPLHRLVFNMNTISNIIIIRVLTYSRSVFSS